MQPSHQWIVFSFFMMVSCRASIVFCNLLMCFSVFCRWCDCARQLISCCSWDFFRALTTSWYLRETSRLLKGKLVNLCVRVRVCMCVCVCVGLQQQHQVIRNCPYLKIKALIKSSPDKMRLLSSHIFSGTKNGTHSQRQDVNIIWFWTPITCMNLMEASAILREGSCCCSAGVKINFW